MHLKLLLLSIFLTLQMPLLASAAPICESLYNPAVIEARAPFLKKAVQAVKGVLLKPEAQDQQSRPSDVSYSEFKDIQRIDSEILAHYPAQNHVYVGLGRSPTAFMAYLKVLGLRNVFSLPLSSMRSHPNRGAMTHASQRRFQNALGPSLQERLWEHFERFLPPGEIMEGRKLVLIDYAQSGASLVSAQHYISEFYWTRGFDVEVVTLPIVDPAFSKYLVGPLRSLPQIYVQSQALKNSLGSEFYDSLSEYGKFDIRESKKASIERNEAYEALIQEFARRLQLQNATTP